MYDISLSRDLGVGFGDETRRGTVRCGVVPQPCVRWLFIFFVEEVPCPILGSHSVDAGAVPDLS